MQTTCLEDSGPVSLSIWKRKIHLNMYWVNKWRKVTLWEAMNDINVERNSVDCSHISNPVNMCHMNEGTWEEKTKIITDLKYGI